MKTITKSKSKSKSKSVNAKKSVAIKRVITTLNFSTEKKSVLISATHNNKKIVFAKQAFIKMILDAKNKDTSKKAFNVNVLSVLLCDRRAKNAKQCKNTCYDRYYKAIKFLLDDVLTDAQVTKYSKNLIMFAKRNKQK